MTPRIPSQRHVQDDADDMTLVRRAQDGDTAAFGELYARHHAHVIQYLVRRCRSQQTAEDLAGDVWVRALRSIGNVAYGSPKAWLLTIARNLAIDYSRSGLGRLEILDEVAARFDRADPGQSTEDAAVAADLSARMAALIKRLPPLQQQAIALTYYGELTSNEAGEAMGKTADAVKGLTLRARRNLLPLLTETLRS